MGGADISIHGNDVCIYDYSMHDFDAMVIQTVTLDRILYGTSFLKIDIDSCFSMLIPLFILFQKIVNYC